MVGLLLGMSAITVPWATLLTSVMLYIVIPVFLAQVWRKVLLAKGQATLDAAMAKIGPWSIAALLATLVLLFAFQGETILNQPLVIALLAVPILSRCFSTPRWRTGSGSATAMLKVLDTRRAPEARWRCSTAA